MTMHGPNIEHYKGMLAVNGYVHLKAGLETPADLTIFAGQFGTVVTQYDGELSFIVQPNLAFDDAYYSNSRMALLPHTEAYEFEVPPRLVFLHCIKPDRHGGGAMMVCDMYPFLDGLSKADSHKLQRARFSFHANEGLSQRGIGRSCRSSFLETHEGVRRFRFSYNNVHFQSKDYFGRKMAEAIMEYFSDNCTELFMERNDVLIIDNYRLLHARKTIFDLNRQICRIWVA